MSHKTPIWAPSTERIANSNLHAFIQSINALSLYVPIDDYSQLHQWSIEHSDEFWQQTWHFSQIIGDMGNETHQIGLEKWQAPCINRDKIWFPQANLNYAENLLDHSRKNPNEYVIRFSNERGEHQQITGQQLLNQVSIVQQWLVNCGVKKGDVVAGYLPYLPQTVIAMLATTSLGAIWTSTSPDFGIDSVLERFGQVEPKVLFCCNGYQFGGKYFDMRDKNHQITAQLNVMLGHHDLAVCEIDDIAFNHSQAHGEPSKDDATKYDSNIENNQNTYINWQSLLEKYHDADVAYQRVPFNHPLFILYSSGTTGQPKCITHSVGGTLLNHLKEHQLHCDIKPFDNVFYYTTCGWMMWNWHVSALASGATLVIYDGSPVYPDASVLWTLAEHDSVSLFGTSAKYLEALEHANYHPKNNHNLTSLQTICSTGSALYPEQFSFVYQNIKTDVHLASISGGTDICGCFVLGNPISPVYKGECQFSGLGVDVQVFNDAGNAVVEQRGELVCNNSLPNFPIGFWKDNGERYHNAYWNKFADVWHHGDDVMLTAQQGYVFFGRSDTTLNPGGIRIGTAEIYQQVNNLPGIVDSIAVGKLQQQSEEIWLMVKLEERTQLTPELTGVIRQTLKQKCSPRHVPKEIFAISDIPKTRSGKLVELAVKQVINGQEVKNLGAIANPEILEEIAKLTARTSV
ncbi:acetoacetate--CoA ligase [Vibrio sinensis]|uniref:Acetoacetate--CoA ligase n=1 Tax=Vibrio sinensis TaxID=2302434 RepID=A0A3A6R390_9VIBR|nr:acetoacetate--CoA ligase [Vibrio sinensis]RJX75607.1 acetoacetate--CoA ligase [Vibrio sinensis]